MTAGARQEGRLLAVVGLLLAAGFSVRAWQRPRGPQPALPAEAAAWEGRLAAARQVDVNTADVAELERLPGVGPALAARIVAYRSQHGPFASVADLTRVSGIGPKTLTSLASYLTVQPAHGTRDPHS